MKKNSPSRVFISATGQNDGKTVVSLGLMHVLAERFKKIGFIKPVGQRYVIENGQMIDEDSVLIEKMFRTKAPIKDMSPIAIEKGFTQKYILNNKKNNKKQKLTEKIKKSFGRVAVNKDMVVIEGTGHAGVGSVFDLSNASVAKILNSKVVIVASGGIGKPIDEIMLNKALFEKEKVGVAGVIINKVRPHKYDKVNKIVRIGLKKHGLNVLGVIPYQKLLSSPTIGQLIEELPCKKLVCNKECLSRYIGKFLVGAMAPHNALKYFSDKSLVITPGDREDLLLAVIGYQMDTIRTNVRISGVILTGGFRPHRAIVDLAKRAGIPLLLAEGDTYSVASRVNNLTVKIKPQDSEKAIIIKEMVEKYVDIDLLLKNI